MSQLRTVDQLRTVLPAPRETTKAKILSFLDEQAIDFLRHLSLWADGHGRSRGADRGVAEGRRTGFVHVEDERTVLLPERAGNNLAFGLQNIIETGRIGMISCVPQPARHCGCLAGRRFLTMPNCSRRSASLVARRCWRSGSTSNAAISTAPVRCFGRSSGNRSTGRKPSASRSERSSRPGPVRTRIKRRKSTPLSSRDTRAIFGRTVDERPLQKALGIDVDLELEIALGLRSRGEPFA